jgi:hypothetical protein
MPLVLMASMLLVVLGTSIWMASLLGFGVITAPIIFRELPRQQAGDITSAILPRYYSWGWYGGLINLSGFIIYALVPGSNDVSWGFYLWSLPLILAMSLWWVAWRKLLPQATKVKNLLYEVHSTEIDSESTHNAVNKELQATFDRLHDLSTGISKFVILLLLTQLCGAISVHVQI